MPNIEKVTFYFAIPQTDSQGNPDHSLPPESHTFLWEDVINNVGISLSTGELIATELSEDDDHVMNIINSLYFGSGKYGSLLAVQYHYEDGTEGWIDEVISYSMNSEYIHMIVGDWIKGLSYEEIINHENWKGTPLIGNDGDFVKIRVKRKIPDIMLMLDPLQKTIKKGESVTFTYSSIDYAEGDVRYEWIYDDNVIQSLSSTDNQHIFQFKVSGTHKVTLTATNVYGQTASKTATITVEEVKESTCELQLTPDAITIHLGETATFTAIHPYSEEGRWIYDEEMLEMIEKTNKTLTVKPKALGSYSISYEVMECLERSILYVVEGPDDDQEWEEPEEPAPPPLPDTPPDAGGSPGPILDLEDATIPESPLYKYPNIMKRNARYRGHRESEKVLNSHQEQIFDIRQLYRDLSILEEKKKTAIESWFHGQKNPSFFTKGKENDVNSLDNDMHYMMRGLDKERGFNKDMLQLKASNTMLDGQMVGINAIKQRIKALDERIAEAERRYRDYENAYK